MNNKLKDVLNKIVMYYSQSASNPQRFLEQLLVLIYWKLFYESNAGNTNLSINSKEASYYNTKLVNFINTHFNDPRIDDLVNKFNDDIIPYIANNLLNEYPDISRYFRFTKLEKNDLSVLKKIFIELQGIELLSLPRDDRGDILYYVITKFIRPNNFGEFYTPKNISSLMVNLLQPRLDEKIYDPACRMGDLLVEACRFIAKTEDERSKINRAGTIKGNNIFGSDSNESALSLARFNFEINSIKQPNLNLSENNNSDLYEENNSLYDVIVCNPPFRSSVNSSRNNEAHNILRNRSEEYYLMKCMKSLRPGGRCGIILPESILSSSSLKSHEIRIKLINNFIIRCIVTLPENVFGSRMNIRTVLLYFEKPTSEIDYGANYVHFFSLRTQDSRIDANDDNYLTSKIEDLKSTLQLYKDGLFMMPFGINGQSEIIESEEQIDAWWVNSNTIEKNDYNLSPLLYKPVIQPRISVEAPESIIQKIIDLQSKLENNTKQLLTYLKDINHKK